MELKLPPILVFIFFVLMMYLVGRFLPFGFFDFYGRFLLAKILSVLAVLVALVSLVQFFRLKTTVDPRNPQKTIRLVTNGLYKYSRNPMYMAMLLLMLAFGLQIGNAFNTLVAAGFVSYMNRFQIIPEERILYQKFGKDYKIYLSQTRRWF